jgi:hypothetical protein
MAKRDTPQEAQALKEKLEKQYPGATIAINEITGSEKMVYPGAIEARGLQDQIVRWEDHPSGQKYPIVKFGATYEILEEKVCAKCGKIWQSAAIGESAQFCSDCSNVSVFGKPARPRPSEWELRDGKPE